MTPPPEQPRSPQLRLALAAMVRAVAIAAMLWAFPAGAAAQAPDTEGTTCRNCANDGRLDCTKHGKGWLERERTVRFCSVAAECKACAGALEVDCKQCRNKKAEDEIAARQEAVRAWRENLRTKIDAEAKGEPMLHLQTEHFDLSFGVKQLTVGKEKLDTHAGMHLYGERLEELYALMLSTLELGDRDFSTRFRVYVCRDALQSTTLAPRVTGIGGSQAIGTKLMGVDAVYCMWMNPRSLPDDAALHRNLVHNVVHLIVSNMEPAGYFGNPKNGWIDEGVAHWFEDRIGGKCTNFCFEEVLMQDGASFKGGRWRVPVRKIADDGKLEALAELGPKNTDQLTFPEHAQAMAMIDYLLAVHGGPKLRDFLRKVKGKTAMRDALQEVYGTTVLRFDSEFDAWVKATYPTQETAK